MPPSGNDLVPSAAQAWCLQRHEPGASSGINLVPPSGTNLAPSAAQTWLPQRHKPGALSAIHLYRPSQGLKRQDNGAEALTSAD